jgi:hypothetical protein
MQLWRNKGPKKLMISFIFISLYMFMVTIFLDSKLLNLWQRAQYGALYASELIGQVVCYRRGIGVPDDSLNIPSARYLSHQLLNNVFTASRESIIINDESTPSRFFGD